MKRKVLFVQGGGEGTHDEWDNHLADSLRTALGEAYEVRYPRMPDEANPDFARWAKALKGEIAALGDGGIIVAHSIGGTVLVHAIADDPPKVKLDGIFVLAAPFVGEGGWPSDDVKSRPQLGSDLPAGVPIYIYHGREDDEIPLSHAELYARAIPQAKLRLLDGKDHQFGNSLDDVAKDILSLR